MQVIAFVQKYFFRIVDAALYSNVFIALCGLGFYWRGMLLNGNKIEFDSISLFVFCATLFTYLFIRLVALRRIRVYQPEHRWNFFLNNYHTLVAVAVVAGIAMLILYFYLPASVQVTFLVPGVISVLYGLPVYRVHGKFVKMRDISLMKILFISFVWAFTGAVLPAVVSGINIFSAQSVLLFTADFCFIFAITLPFDVKDLEIDLLHNVKTIPSLIGADATYGLSIFLLFLSGVFYAIRQPSSELFLLAPLTVSVILAGMLIYLTKFQNNSRLYFGLIDGTILLQFLLVWLYVIVKY